MLGRVLSATLLMSAMLSGARAAPLTVFAAASLTEALGDAGRLWAAQGHEAPRFSFAASSTLAQGILHGANEAYRAEFQARRKPGMRRTSTSVGVDTYRPLIPSPEFAQMSS